MNAHESEKIMAILLGKGLKQAASLEQAHVIVYNTCCIRGTAEAKIYGHLGKAKKIKEQNPDVKIVLCGCLPQKPDMAQRLVKKYPYIDLMIGTHNIALLGEYLDNLKRGINLEIWEAEREAPEIKAHRQSGVKAFLNIMYGCNNFCSYCVVPYVRGRERSRDFDVILGEVKELVKDGFKEITLLGQNVNSYNFKGKNFAALLNELNNLDYNYKLKFMTSHPKDLSDEVIKIVASGKNLAKYIHLPVQAGSDRILSLMNRKYSCADYLKKIDTIKNNIADVGLSTDIMAGFPTETDQEFNHTLSLAETVKFNSIFTFIYNRRSGTPADSMDGQVPEEIKKQRIERLIALQAKIGAQRAQGAINKTYQVLCESQNGNACYGKAQNDMAVSFNSDKNVYGQFVSVKITGHKNSQLIGNIIN